MLIDKFINFSLKNKNKFLFFIIVVLALVMSDILPDRFGD